MKPSFDVESVNGTPYDLTLKMRSYGYSSIPAPDGISNKIEITFDKPLTTEEAEELGALLVKIQKRMSSTSNDRFK